MNKVIETLKSFYGIAASIGVIIPGFSFFNNYAPPLFTGIAILTVALSVAVIVIIVNNDDQIKSTKTVVKKHTSKSIKFLASSFVLILMYLMLMDFTTIVPEDFPEERWQVGFDMEQWSLTPLANSMLLDNSCNQNKEALLSCASVQKENVFLIWTKLSVYSAGLILILIFTTASLLWSAGWTYLAKLHLIKNNSTE